MYNVYSTKEPMGRQVETAEQAWQELRSMDIKDMPRIDLMLEVGRDVVSFCVGTTYSVIYTGLDNIFDMTTEEMQKGIEDIDALINAYGDEDARRSLTVFGSRDRVIYNKTEQVELIDYEYK